ncbi:MAG: glycosyltransferase family 2 protein [Bacillota bacterium]
MTSVSILIPAYNEERNIGATLEALKGLKGISQVMVVDDASTDKTFEMAEKAGAETIRLERRSGKGGALNRGIPYLQGQVVALLDADLGSSAADVINILEPVLSGETDMAIARFPAPSQKGGFGLTQGFARTGVSFLTGRYVSACLSGQRAMTRELLHKLAPLAPGFGVEVAMTVEALRMGYRVREVEVSMRHRETGRNWRGFMHRGKQFYAVGLGLFLGSQKVKRCP